MSARTRRLSGLGGCRRGATVVEFALVAPVFLVMLFGLIETGRALWTRQTLEEVAYATARCMSVGSDCATAAARQTFAVARAQALGVSLLAANVTATAGASCNGAKANQVVVASAFVSGASGLVPLPGTITATACFPVLS